MQAETKSLGINSVCNMFFLMTNKLNLLSKKQNVMWHQAKNSTCFNASCYVNSDFYWTLFEKLLSKHFYNNLRIYCFRFDDTVE
jgi:hypothetical protein